MQQLLPDISAHAPAMALDKSFAQGTNHLKLAVLCENFVFLVPSPFYYEVFKNDPQKRRFTLRGLNEFRRVDIPTFLRRETRSGNPALDGDLQRLCVNPDVLDDAWTMRPGDQSTMDGHKTHIVSPSLEFWNAVIDQGVIGFSPAEYCAVHGTDAEFADLCAKLRDVGRIRAIAAQLGFRHASKIDGTWFHFRRYQAMILQGLVLCRRYPRPGDRRDLTRMEHDIHDLDYLVLGLLTGRLATAETSSDPRKVSMGWRFKLLEPSGHLMTPVALRA
jgi:hypothetical protein